MGLSVEDREILIDFINEANEGLEKAEQLLLNMEENLSERKKVDNSLIDHLFRIFHSIKGNAGFLGLKGINALTHQAESLLDRIRKGRLTPERAHIDIFFEVCDVLQLVLEHLRENEEERGLNVDFANLIERLKKMTEDEGDKNAVKKVAESQIPASSASIGEPPLNDEWLVSEDMKKEFAAEGRELLDQLERDLMALEKKPKDMEILNRIFRVLHTLKGSAGFLGLSDIQEICHKTETIFDLARAGALLLQERQISLLLQIVDFIGVALDALNAGKPAVIAGKNALLDLLNDLVPLPDRQEPEKAEPSPQDKEALTAPKHDARSAIQQQKKTSGSSTHKLSDVVRVEIPKLNRLMDLVGEIVIAESSLLNYYQFQENENEEFLKSLTYLRKNIRALQELATSMRMVPLSGLLTKMQRLVRDISRQKGKQAELIINGGDTEVDRSVIEHISDPLIHILRNSLDHGIELPEKREEKGKPAKGRIEIDVQRVGGQIWIQVKDDGQGLNKEKILKRAWERGLISEGQVPENDQALYDLIFQPGFSTADKVTDISGRGVGMDVVRKNIEKIRGTLTLTTVPGNGTTIIMKIPLTTAVIDGMLLRVAESLYAIPMLDIREALRIGDQYLIELIDGQEMIRVREQLIPLIRLDFIHGQVKSNSNDHNKLVVISEMAGKAVGLVVDEILGEQQLVLKPLPRYLGELVGVSSCAVLGNGEICYVLDLSALLSFLQSRFLNAGSKTILLEA